MYYYLGDFFDLMCQFAVLLDNLHKLVLCLKLPFG